ncbi:MAG: transposase [Spirochaetales bacterium]|nr:transposase [Spirochaetales bacterium]
MLYKQDKNLDALDEMLFNSLLSDDHLLVQIEKHIDFTFVYDKVKDSYKSKGRNSKDPAMMVKILLLEYLYKLSDVQVTERIQVDISFRWFLGLGTQERVPDSSTISYFRGNRLKEKLFKEIINNLAIQCIDKGLIKRKSYKLYSIDDD